MAKVLTDTMCKSDPTSEDFGGRKRLDFTDSVTPGLQLRKLPSGRKIWRFRYTARDGQQRSINIGEYPSTSAGSLPKLGLAAARAKAGAVRERIDKGEDPAAERDGYHEAETLAQVADEYLEARKGLKSIDEHRHSFETYILPALGTMKAVDVTHRLVRQLVIDAHFRDAETGRPVKPRARNKALQHGARLFKWAASPSRGYVPQGHNPFTAPDGETDWKAPERAYSTALKPDELDRLMDAIDAELGREPTWVDRIVETLSEADEPLTVAELARRIKHDRSHVVQLLSYMVRERQDPRIARLGEGRYEYTSAPYEDPSTMGPVLRALFRLYPWTGARKSELRLARWRDVNWEERFILVPDPKKTRADDTRERRLPLHSRAIRELAELQQRTQPPEDGSGFIFKSERSHKRPVSDATVRRAWHRIRDRAKFGRRVRIHDLRHSFVTAFLEAGGRLEMASEAAGHADVRITKARYGHIQPRTVADQTELFAPGGTGKVALPENVLAMGDTSERP